MTSSYQTLLLDVDDRGVAYVTLNRPDKRNALSSTMINELTDMARTVGASPNTRVIVLAGAGKLFCAGADLNWMMTQINADRETRKREARAIATMLGALNTMPTPMIGRLHGACMAGAVGLASTCDVIVAESATRFALTETRLGLIPATISPYVVARIGEGMARRIFMSAREFDAVEAQQMGLVSACVPAEHLAAAIEAEIQPYLSVAAGAAGAAKSLVRALGAEIDDALIEQTIDKLADCWETEEAAEGIASFLEKRKPSWVSQH